CSIRRSKPCRTLRYPATRCLNPSGPGFLVGVVGVVVDVVRCYNSSTVAQLAPFQISSNWRRTSFWFCSVPIEGLLFPSEERLLLLHGVALLLNTYILVAREGP